MKNLSCHTFFCELVTSLLRRGIQIQKMGWLIGLSMPYGLVLCISYICCYFQVSKSNVATLVKQADI
jgi:hypothetical protein